MAHTTPTILVATDLSARSDRPLDRALLLRRQLGAELLLLHVVDGEGPIRAAEAARLRRIAEEEFGDRIAEAEFLVERGPVAATIARVAEERGCGVIITGVARFNSPADYVLGTTVDYLVRRSLVPVLVVKRRPERLYDRLLVATDFSSGSAKALGAAASLFPQARLKAVHVVHAAYEAWLDPKATGDFARREAEEEMGDLLARLPGEVRARAEGVVEEGELDSAIAIAARAWPADLLVVGSHGRGGFAHATIGSRASELLASQRCDVLVVRLSA